MKFLIPILGTALMMVGCQQQPAIQQAVPVAKPVAKPVVEPAIKTAVKAYTPKPPKKNIKLKKVEDENFSSEYMYPETNKKAVRKSKEPTSPATVSPSVSAMTNEECISMIGQEKFDKYAQMFGGDTGALKKCKMLKAL